jgi:peptide/nickel transport system substrate-binding protein
MRGKKMDNAVSRIRHAAGCALLAGALALGATALEAKTLKMANQGDVTSMDPHSLNESFQLSFLGNIYDSLVLFNKQSGIAPALATEWKQTNPTTWRFTLRRGVAFHDGTPFNADDVVFSFNRALSEGSDVKSAISTVAEVKKVDDYTVDIVTKVPFPILVENLRALYVMSKKWCEANGATGPVDVRKGKENAATLKTNGTGPFMLKSRAPGVKTEIVVNP